MILLFKEENATSEEYCRIFTYPGPETSLSKMLSTTKWHNCVFVNNTLDKSAWGRIYWIKLDAWITHLSCCFHFPLCYLWVMSEAPYMMRPGQSPLLLWGCSSRRKSLFSQVLCIWVMRRKEKDGGEAGGREGPDTCSSSRTQDWRQPVSR